MLAQPLAADRDQPPFARSTRDGFACRAAEASTHEPLALAGATRAGEAPAGPLPPGAAWEIMTGAPVPAGADAVMMLEHVEVSRRQGPAAAAPQVKPGENIVAQGAQARQGDELLPAGTALHAAQIALAAACGCAALDVFVRPRVAILATGDELVPVESSPAPGQIRNSNGPMLAAMVAAAGGEPWLLPAAADNAQALDAALAQAAEADLLLISGGVSAGKFDLVEPALARAGARFHFTGVRIQPGKPLVFGELPRSAMQASTKTRHGAQVLLRASRQSGLFRRHFSALRRAGAGRAGRQPGDRSALCPGAAGQRQPTSTASRASRAFCPRTATSARPPASCRRLPWFPGTARAIWPPWPAPTAFSSCPKKLHRWIRRTGRISLPHPCFSEGDVALRRTTVPEIHAIASSPTSIHPARPPWWM